MATRSRRSSAPPIARKTPPINAEIFRIRRQNVTVWEGREPAYTRQQHEWVPTSVGAYVSRSTVELAIPTLGEVAPAEAPDFGEPIDPPDLPDPPDPDPDSPDYPYDPPTVGAPTAPLPGTYQDLLSKQVGYNLTNRVSYNEIPLVATREYPSGTPGYVMPPPNFCWGWQKALNGDGSGHSGGVVRRTVSSPPVVFDLDTAPYYSEQSDTGGLHWSLGTAPAGLVDQTGGGHTGAPLGGVLPGGVPGKLKLGDRAAYFNGNDGRIVSNFNPFWVAPPSADYLERSGIFGEFAGHGVATLGDSWDTYTHVFNDFPKMPPQTGRSPTLEGTLTPECAAMVRYSDNGYHFFPSYSGSGVGVGEPSTPTAPIALGISAPTITISGWVRREDTNDDHTIFTSSGPDKYRFYLPAGSRQPVWEAPPSVDDLGMAERTEYKWPPSTWPADQSQWVHFSLEFGWNLGRGYAVDESGLIALSVNGVRKDSGFFRARVPSNLKRIFNAELGQLEIVAADHGGIVLGSNTDSWKGSIDEFSVLRWQAVCKAEPPGPPYGGYVETEGLAAELYKTDPATPTPTTFALDRAVSASPMAAATPSSSPATNGSRVSTGEPVTPQNGDLVYYRYHGDEYELIVGGVEDRRDYGFWRLSGFFPD